MKKCLLNLIPLFFFTSCSSYDDSSLWNAVNGNSSKIQSLQTQVDNLNNRVNELKSLVDAVNQKETIEKVSELSDGTGYTILFTSGKSIVIHHGKDGQDGKDGQTPVIGVKQDSDGIWYWTANGQWLLDSRGNKVRASAQDGKDGVDGKDGQDGADGKDGQDGKDGADGKDGVTPMLKIENDCWYVSVDNGSTWSLLGRATGQDGKDGADGKDGKDGKDGDSFFKSVYTDENYAYFELTDGTVITLPLASAQKFNIILDSDNVPVIDPGKSRSIGYRIVKATDKTIVKTVARDGWVATVNAMQKDTGEIIVQAPNPIVSSDILVFASDGYGNTVMAALDCEHGKCTVAKDSYTVDAAGGEIELVITTNMPYRIEIPYEAQSWISERPATKATVVERRTLVIAENTAYQKRFATINLTDGNGTVLQPVAILQEAAVFPGDLSVTVTEPGTLKSILSPYSFETIKGLSVTGPLNEADYSCIKDDLVSLRRLNLSGATGIEPNFRNHQYTLDVVILPSSRTSISDYAFENSYIVSIVLPEKLQSIGTGAFYNCSRMTGAISIPKSVTYIGKNAFNGTKSESITFADGINLTKFEDNSLPPLTTSLRIPASVVSISYGAFENFTALKHLSFETGSVITDIPKLCFAGLPLETVSLPPSLTKISGEPTATTWRGGPIHGKYLSRFYNGAFECCESLKSIKIPMNVETIEPAAFRSSGLESVTFDDDCKIETISGWSFNLGDRVGAFSQTKKLESVVIPSSVTVIQNGAFAESSLRSVDFSKAKNLKIIGGSVSSSGDCQSGAFYECTGIQSIEIPPSVEEIEVCAFAECSGMVSLTFAQNSRLSKLSGSPSYYGAGAFSGCSGISQVTIPASVKSIEGGAFYNCSSLKIVNFENGTLCENISGGKEYGPFSGTSISCITLPKSLNVADTCAFANMKYLTKVILAPGANVSFSYRSFYDSASLSEIDASQASFTAAYCAFNIYGLVDLPYCPIKTVKIGAIRPPECAENAFTNGTTVPSATLYVPAESVSEYKQATGWKKFGTIIPL